jgi:hypothetical protein
VTPLSLQLDPGSYSLVLSLSGYQTYSTTATVVSSQTTVITATLTATPSGPAKYESNESANSQDVFYGSSWKAQTFTPQVTHTVTLIKLPLLRVGTPPGNVVVSIRNVDASGYPTGADLASGSITCSSVITNWSPMTWYDVSLGNGCLLQAGKTYAIIFRAPDAISTNRPFYWINDAGTYGRGRCLFSWNSGSTWLDVASPNTWDVAFQEWGVSQ